MYSISEVSKKLSVHNQTLRNWERNGLVKPKRFGHVRIFSELDLKRCEEIKKYSRRGVSLQHVQALLGMRMKAQDEKTGNGG
jgi:MerR family transcriptional regulator/heat shock protein HspR